MSQGSFERLQREHYDRIAEGYEAHYSDRWSHRYRDHFVNARLFAGMDLKGLKVLDAMAGSGELSEYLLRQGADVTAIDVSPAVMAKFRAKFPGAHGVTASIFDSGLEAESFDCVGVFQGLHHVQPRAEQAVDELWRVLRPGGWLVFAEPHTGSLPDAARRLWYRFDPLFEANEAAVDVARLEAVNRDRFEVVETIYTGNLAYLLVYNSMVFRVPHAVKRLYTPLMLTLEGWLEKVQGPRMACFAIVRWRKKPVA